MTGNTWWLFFVTVFVLSGTPGPNMLHILSRSVSLGAWRSVPAMVGCMLAVLLVLAASAVGLGALLLASPRVFEALRYLGVSYLIWLGIRAWRGDGSAVDAAQAAVPLRLTRFQVFRGGLLTGLSNPKLLLFAAAFLPQFVNPSKPQWPQFMVLVVTFALCEFLWYLVYATGGAQLRRQLTRPALRRAFDRLTGMVFVGFGVLLLRFRPQ